MTRDISCKYCGEDMIVASEDPYGFYTDIYYLCNSCNTACVLQQSGREVLSENWYVGD